MIRILVVEDQAEKRRQILAHLTSLSGISLENTTHVDNVMDAKRQLKSSKFDLLILDINVPKRSDEPPSRSAGLELITFIKSNDLAIPPSYIFGMTAYDGEFADASIMFSSALWKLIKFSPEDHGWKDALSDAVSFLVSKDRPPYVNDGTTYHVDIGLVVALDEELAPFKRILDRWEELKVAYDPARYFRGELEVEGRKISVVAVVSPRMGLPTAAVTATKLILAFRPRYIITAGICAGVKDKTAIGDLLISDPCFDWGSGKWVKSRGKTITFKPAAYPWRLSEQLRREISVLGEDSDLLKQLAQSYVGRRPLNVPAVRIDAMASGGSVLQAESLMADIRAQHKNLIGIDMENYGVLTAVEYCGEPQAKAVAVKSVCDFGDGKKNDDFHGYAAYMSANFVCKIILSLHKD